MLPNQKSYEEKHDRRLMGHQSLSYLTYLFTNTTVVQTSGDTKSCLIFTFLMAEITRYSSSTDSGPQLDKMCAQLTHFRHKCLGIFASIIIEPAFQDRNLD